VKTFRSIILLLLLLFLPPLSNAAPKVVFETTSTYHHIRVVEDRGLRILYFDDAPETSMSIANPLQGHFEYTDYFHMPWLWNTNISWVLMVGLGGASTQRSFAHYYPRVKIDTVEIDPSVVEVARAYFGYTESEAQKIHVDDGRLYLRRTTDRYDLLILDAYIQGRYGSSIPQHLATREFFELARDHLTTNGVVAYNVIGTLTSWHSEIVGAIYHTLKSVFPQVYVFPAQTSQNIVLVATRAGIQVNPNTLRPRAHFLTETKFITMPAFISRMERMQVSPPTSAARSPILTDDFAPVEGLSAAAGKE
jgi:spermidine synthase